MNNRQDTIKNKAILTFDLLGKYHAIESNEVEAKKVNIRVRKEQSCNVAFAGDKICYTVLICNDSCIDLYDLDFRDGIDQDVEYERNSFKVNYECKQPQMSGNTLYYHINKLKAREELIISFDVKVKPECVC